MGTKTVSGLLFTEDLAVSCDGLQKSVNHALSEKKREEEEEERKEEEVNQRMNASFWSIVLILCL
jgi:hypothetical protein